MTFGSLFSGIGGLDRALEHFGHTPIWQAENEPAARRVLACHWPKVHCFKDVREIDGNAPRPDIVCGGFPCQDISVAGKGAGIDGERSGLWSEFARIIRELRPSVVFVENVPPIVKRGLDRVLADLAEVGMDATWDCFRASDVGAPHKRERFFLLAYTDRERVREFAERNQREGRSERTAERGDAESVHDCAQLAYTDGVGLQTRIGRRGFQAGRPDVEQGDRGQRAGQVADTDGGRREGVGIAQPGDLEGSRGRVTDGRGDVGSVHLFPPGPDEISRWDGPQPAVRRSDARIPAGLDRGWRTKNRVSDRLQLLGNACVPQQAALAIEVLSARVLGCDEAITS